MELILIVLFTTLIMVIPLLLIPGICDYSLEKDWSIRATHKCGYIDKYSRYGQEICPKCGSMDKEWKAKKVRMVNIFRKYEIKDL